MEETIVIGIWKGHLGLGLAPRKLEFVLYIAQGLTSKEIGKVAGLSHNGVVKRISSAMFKLKVTRRTAMVAQAIKLQIITPL
jgi:DNA-binding CsgD family transcriptional regulator